MHRSSAQKPPASGCTKHHVTPPAPPRLLRPSPATRHHASPSSSSGSGSAACGAGMDGRCRRRHACSCSADAPSLAPVTEPACADPPRRVTYAPRRQAASRPLAAASAATSRRPGQCFRCGGEGHWSSECTQPPQQRVFTPTAAAATLDKCFRCGQPGHWASACPQPPPPPPPQQQQQPVSLPGTCHRCGQAGHWVRDCPQPPAPRASTASTPSAEPPASTLHLARLFPSSTELLLPSREPGYARHHLQADQRSEDWHAARDCRLTASSILKAVGISPLKSGAMGASPRVSLFHEKLDITQVKMSYAMEHGVRNEPVALREYCRLTESSVVSCDFVAYQRIPASLQLPGHPPVPGDAWLGGSPDGLILGSDAATQVLHRLAATSADAAPAAAAAAAQGAAPGQELLTLMDNAGILEIKCPVSPGTGDADKNSKYLFQIQALMEILDVGWADLFVANLKEQQLLQVRVQRDREFWAALEPHLRSFWWDNVLPARQALEQRFGEERSAASVEEQKAAVREYAPSELAGGATAQLRERAREMYEGADKEMVFI